MVVVDAVVSRYDVCSSVEFTFFFRMIHVRSLCHTSQSHLGKDVDFFRHHKTKSVYFERRRKHEWKEMQKTAFTNFTGQWWLNTWWIHIEQSQLNRKLHSTKENMQSVWPKQLFLLLWKWRRKCMLRENRKWREKTIRFGGKLKAQPSDQLWSSTLQTSRFVFWQLTWKMKLSLVWKQISLDAQENQTDTQLVKLAGKKLCTNKVFIFTLCEIMVSKYWLWNAENFNFFVVLIWYVGAIVKMIHAKVFGNPESG